MNSKIVNCSFKFLLLFFYWLPSIKITSGGRDRFSVCKLSGTKEAAICVDGVEVAESGLPVCSTLRLPTGM